MERVVTACTYDSDVASTFGPKIRNKNRLSVSPLYKTSISVTNVNNRTINECQTYLSWSMARANSQIVTRFNSDVCAKRCQNSFADFSRFTCANLDNIVPLLKRWKITTSYVKTEFISCYCRMCCVWYNKCSSQTINSDTH